MCTLKNNNRIIISILTEVLPVLTKIRSDKTYVIKSFNSDVYVAKCDIYN